MTVCENGNGNRCTGRTTNTLLENALLLPPVRKRLAAYRASCPAGERKSTCCLKLLGIQSGLSEMPTNPDFRLEKIRITGFPNFGFTVVEFCALIENQFITKYAWLSKPCHKSCRRFLTNFDESGFFPSLRRWQLILTFEIILLDACEIIIIPNCITLLYA